MRIKRVINRFLLNRFYRSLTARLAVVLCIVILIPMVFSGWFLVNRSQSAVKKSVLANHQEIVNRAAEEISLILKHSQDILNAAAQVIGFARFDPWHQETALVWLTLEHPAFIRVSSFELSGKMIATSDLGKSFVLNYPDNIIRLPLEGKTYISEIKFRDLDNLPYIAISLPVQENGKVTGILAAELNLRSMWDIVDGIRIGNTGRAFLLSDEGLLLASPDKKQILRKEKFRKQGGADFFRFSEEGSLLLEGGRQKKFISSYAPVPNTNWGVVLRQEESEACLFSRVMKWQSWIIIFFCGIIAALAAVFLARLFVRPVKSLLEKLKGASSGLAGDQKDLKRHDEFGDLIKIFDTLTEKLKTAKSKEKFSSIGEAAVWVAHELKNSLTPIKSFVQLLRYKHSDDKFIDKFQDIVPEEINRCERILRELSDFSSSTGLKLNWISLKDVMDEVLRILESRFSENHIEVNFLAYNTNIYIHGDAEKLKQVFINLLINAVSAMPNGGSINVGLRKIKPVYAKNPAFVELSIGDTGIGISQDRLKNIFEPFKSTKKDGMGLGLAISRRIIEQHAGQIWAESELGQGTVFTIRFPQGKVDIKSGEDTVNKISE
jgi:signal transduction histidine kinase